MLPSVSELGKTSNFTAVTMQKLKFYSLLLFLLPVLAPAQDLYVVNINGLVTSIEDGEPIPYAHVINPRVHGGTTTNVDGMFSIRILTEDTLIIRAVGFVDEKLTINEFPPKERYDVKLKPVRFLLREVTITEDNLMRKKLGLPEFEPLNIPTELRGDAFNEKPKWYDAFLTPISFIQYHASAKEKEKREIRRIMMDNEEWLTFSTYHNLENIKRLTGLKGEEADKFMIYCNLNNRLPHFAGQIEIEFQIMDLYFKYKKEKEESNSN